MVLGANPKPNPAPNDKSFVESTPNAEPNITPVFTNVIGANRPKPLDDEEYRNYLTYLFTESVQPKINKYRNESYNLSDYPDIKKLIENPLSLPALTKETMDIVSFVVNYCETEFEIETWFNRRKLEFAIDNANRIVKSVKSLAQVLGFIDVLDNHLESIMGGLKLDHLPQKDFEVLQYLGSKDSKIELEGSIYQFRTQMLNHTGLFSSVPIIKASRILDETENLLTKAIDATTYGDEMHKDTSTKKPKRKPRASSQKIEHSSNGPIGTSTSTTPSKRVRLFKGLKKIIPGACIFTANIGSVIASSYLQIDNGTAYGSMASSALGTFKIFEGTAVASGQKSDDQHTPLSVADELIKLAKLRDEKNITEQDFQRIKQSLMSKLD